jgi:hypothetical protein
VAHEDWTVGLPGGVQLARFDALPIEAVINEDERWLFGELLKRRWSWPEIEAAFAIICELEQARGDVAYLIDCVDEHDPDLRSIAQIIAAAIAKWKADDSGAGAFSTRRPFMPELSEAHG